MKLNYKRTFFVGFAFFLICAFWQAYDTLIPKILTDKFGMDQGFSGVIMAFDNILALFLLPLFGSLSDKHKGKRGKRTPFIIIGTVVASVMFIVLSYGDYMQLDNIRAAASSDKAALSVVYDNQEGKTLKTPDGEYFVLSDEKVEGKVTLSKDEFTEIKLETIDENGKTVTNADYNNYVIPARQAYAWQQTMASPLTLVFFVVVLLIVLLSMALFRSPAVALMPDVTIKPLRSKANAVINLMGTAGAIVVLVLGIIFGTGKASNALMSYSPFFIIIALIMLISLGIFLMFVNEPKFVKEMKEESAKYNIDEEDEDENSGDRRLSKSEFASLILILLSVVFWYMGYNAVTSKYSVYAGKVLNLDYNLTLMIASGAALISYLPVGIISSKIGRKKTILAGVVMLCVSFTAAAFMRAGSPVMLMNGLFALAGIGWATINVNSYPMIVELARGGNVGKYTGYYYAASMSAQALTPVLSGFLMNWKFTSLFPYAAVFVALAFITMILVKHGDNKPTAKKGLEIFDED